MIQKHKLNYWSCSTNLGTIAIGSFRPWMLLFRAKFPLESPQNPPARSRPQNLELSLKINQALIPLKETRETHEQWKAHTQEHTTQRRLKYLLLLLHHALDKLKEIPHNP